MKRLILTAIAAASVLGPMAAANASQAQNYGRDRDRDGRPDNSYYDRYDNRRGERWDERRHNGYNWNGRWYYGPPPRSYYGDPSFSLGWHDWQRGERMPGYYGRGYVVNDWNRYGLHRPPQGYEWRRVGDDYLMVAIASGLIAEVLRH